MWFTQKHDRAWPLCLHARAFMWRSISKCISLISVTSHLSLSLSLSLDAVTWTATISSLFLTSEGASSGYGVRRSTSRAPDWLTWLPATAVLFHLPHSPATWYHLGHLQRTGSAAWKTKCMQMKFVPHNNKSAGCKNLLCSSLQMSA